MVPTLLITTSLLIPLLSIFFLQQWTPPLSIASIQCLILRLSLRDKISFPTSLAYETTRQAYWSQQQQNLTPTCIIHPQTHTDVASTVAIMSTFARLTSGLGLGRCKVAIKGGGHTSWAGSSNEDGGVTIDMGAMNQVQISDDKTVASVGPGAKWIEVYETLDPLQLVVVGGPLASVGVAGFLLGGGISFLSPRYGWGCDNILNYEIVLADGTIANTNLTSHPSLSAALKGGSNNFGVVTRFDLRTFPQGDIWGGSFTTGIESREEVHDALVEFNKDKGYDEYASAINNFVWTTTTKEWMVSNTLIYSKDEKYPKALEPFTRVEPVYNQTLRTTNLSSLTLALDQGAPRGLRYLSITTTIPSSTHLLPTLFTLANQTLQPLLPLPSLFYALSFQPLPPKLTQHSNHSTNMLGPFSPSPQILALLNIHWKDASDDETVNSAAEKWLRLANEEARKTAIHKGGDDSGWVYLNYAHQTQGSYDYDEHASEGWAEGYRRKRLEFMRSVSREVDPHRFFQESVVGGFKIPEEERCVGEI